MLPLHVFEDVVPLRIPITLLLRSLAAADFEAARAFGALGLEEEDLALCSYLCPSKLEYGDLLRSALDELGADLDGWHRLYEHEIALGAPHERARVKVVPREEMVRVSRGE